MMKRSSTLATALRLGAGLVLIALIFPTPAHAYIDPASGSIILQVIAAGALAAAFTFRRFTLKMRLVARSVWTRLRPR